MILALIILSTLIFVERETFRDSEFGNTKHWNRFLIRLIVPIIIGLITWNWIYAALSFSLFYLVFDPLLNIRSGASFFHTSTGTWKQILTGEKSFYDVIDGRIALMIESFVFIILLFESM